MEPTRTPRTQRTTKRRPLAPKREEFKDKIIDLRRVARVTSGGKRFRFRATIVIGDERGRVGVGVGKGNDVAQTIAKAKANAKREVLTVPLKGRTIPHEVEAKFSAARVILKPAGEGHGLIAGGAARTVLALAGVKDITAKCVGRTSNKLTNALATIEALKLFKDERPRDRGGEPSSREHEPASDENSATLLPTP